MAEKKKRKQSVKHVRMHVLFTHLHECDGSVNRVAFFIVEVFRLVAVYEKESTKRKEAFACATSKGVRM